MRHVMEFKAILFVLIGSEVFLEGNTQEYSPMPGVNGARGSTREPRPFDCTIPVNARHGASESAATKKSTTQWPLTFETTTSYLKAESPISLSNTRPATEPSTTGQQSVTSNQKLTSTASTEHGLSYSQQIIKQLASTSPVEQGLTSEQRFTKQVTSTPPTEQGLTSTERTTKQQTSTLATSPPCVPNMVLGPRCDCVATCQDPISCNCTGPETCVCPDGFLMNYNECIPGQNCGCYYVQDGRTYVNGNCSARCTCNNNRVRCNLAYTCSLHVSCRVEDGVRQCYCKDGYEGDGQTCEKIYTDCYDAYLDGQMQDGVFKILPFGWSEDPFNVFCDMTTSGGGWTILQRRINGQNFSRNWRAYRRGFRSTSGSHWLGNNKLFFLTNQRNYTLRVDLVDSDNSTTYQEYSLFKIANESDQYRLISLGNSSGTAGWLSYGF